MDYRQQLEPLALMLRDVVPGLSFHTLEIGALPLGHKAERFHCLPDLFPGSRITAFELDEKACAAWNESAPTGLRYYATALGKAREERVLYETQAPMCSSLYKPNAKLLAQFSSLEVVSLKQTHTLTTDTLDHFLEQHNLPLVDAVKIDIQGAELDVFLGGRQALSQVQFVVSEVEFVPLYEDQPLFGDVSAELTRHGLMFHKFLHLSGRPRAPLAINGNQRHASQHLWADAVFVPDFADEPKRSADDWARSATFAFLYGSSDLAYSCLQKVDQLLGSDLGAEFLARVASLSTMGDA